MIQHCTKKEENYLGRLFVFYIFYFHTRFLLFYCWNFILKLKQRIRYQSQILFIFRNTVICVIVYFNTSSNNSESIRILFLFWLRTWVFNSDFTHVNVGNSIYYWKREKQKSELKFELKSRSLSHWIVFNFVPINLEDSIRKTWKLSLEDN